MTRVVLQRSRFVVALLGAGLCACGNAGRPRPLEANAAVFEPDSPNARLSLRLRELQTRASFLMFTAHPDDEDGGTLVYETRGQGARGALFTITRGEGGQNVMSGDLYDSLGLIRTQELLRSDRYYGVDQYFSRLIDYGFSKTPEEAMEKWGHDRLLSDAVRVVRTVRPLVIIAEFLGSAVDGHGNHQVAGRLAQEAYIAAGDPDKFPEQIREGLRPWSPLKIYARVPRVRVIPLQGIYDYASDKYVPVEFVDYVHQTQSKTLPTATLQIHEGEREPGSGLTFLEIARAALSYQRSQDGDGRLPDAAPFASSYHRYASRQPTGEQETSFFDGIDVTVAGIAGGITGNANFLNDGLSELSQLASDALNRYQSGQPAGIAPCLADGLRITRALIEETKISSLTEPRRSDVLFELGAKEQQFQQALAAALDASIEATANENSDGSALTMTAPGQTFQIEERIVNRGTEDLKVERTDVIASDRKDWRIQSNASPPHDVGAHKEVHFRVSISAPADAEISRPYFSRPNEEQPYYDLIDERHRNLPFAPYPLQARARLAYRGVAFTLERPVETASSVPGTGKVRTPLLVGPAISVAVSPSAGAVPLGATSFAFACTIHSNISMGPAEGVVRLKLPEGWRSDPRESRFVLTRYGEDRTISFSISPAMLKSVAYTITASADYKGRSYTEGYHLAGYQDLPSYPYYRPAEYRAVGVDAIVAPGLKVGFIPGTGDEVPKALNSLRQEVSVLTTSDLLRGDLSAYDSIILGVRAYAVRADLQAANHRLIDYVRQGGVLVVQYNLEKFDHDYGPYWLRLGSNPQKVVDENSPVRLLEPANPVFTWPNRITDADFRDWVEERGHGFLKAWDRRYLPLLETHDPGQDPQKGGLLLARYGRGFYVYDAFALYRQLPSGVPGAFRIIANLVSLKKNPRWK